MSTTYLASVKHSPKLNHATISLQISALIMLHSYYWAWAGAAIINWYNVFNFRGHTINFAERMELIQASGMLMLRWRKKIPWSTALSPGLQPPTWASLSTMISRTSPGGWRTGGILRNDDKPKKVIWAEKIRKNQLYHALYSQRSPFSSLFFCLKHLFLNIWLEYSSCWRLWTPGPWRSRPWTASSISSFCSTC